MNLPITGPTQARFMIGQGFRYQHVLQRSAFLADLQIRIAVVALEGMMQLGLQGIFRIVSKADLLRQYQNAAGYGGLGQALNQRVCPGR